MVCLPRVLWDVGWWPVPWREGSVEDLSAEGLRAPQAEARASVLTAVVAFATTRMIAMAGSLSWVTIGPSVGVDGVTCVSVAAETLVHRDRGELPTVS